MLKFSATALLALILFYSRTGCPLAGETFAITDKQTEFAQSLPDRIPGVVSAEWQSPLDIWVEAASTGRESAKNAAIDVILDGKDTLDQSFCVHVHEGDFKQIAFTCWSSP